MPIDHIVFVVDDDASVRDAVAELLSSAHHEVETFGSAAEYLAFSRPDLPACLVLDVELPDMSGLELQRRLDTDEHPPIVFLTGHGDVPRTVRALKAGAILEHDIRPAPYGKIAILADPFGHGLCLIEFIGRGYDEIAQA